MELTSWGGILPIPILLAAIAIAIAVAIALVVVVVVAATLPDKNTDDNESIVSS